ncbi:MAG: RsmB/NOP family class I SAM-dependent RNA methyltransferase [Nanoarchaeota archaeon]|nr:RsmB/NOP family class I SAM-dependent RNA methyltransferase [Nanoarchaeota archaeon]MBU4493074.1 RsmB/NOP family class I SAM-dependent RNA methyltransferase [Nanoarchaeota archaeon]
MLKKIPKTENIKIKEKFEERYRVLLGKDYKKFIETSLSFMRKSIRVNTLKITIDELKKRLEKEWKLTQIPWCKQGFFIEHKKGLRRDIGNLIEHNLGYFYVQEAASMIPAVVLNPKPDDIVLDMCSAPGSKTTQIAAMMQNKGVLVSNDSDYKRMAPLSFNIQRTGATNTLVTLMEGRFFKMPFDKILLDAPCSGTGTIRKSLKTLKMWNPNMVKRIAGTQRQLIDVAFNCLNPGGVMTYSTCTLEPEENEAIIDFLLNKYENAKLEKINLNIKHGPVITDFNGQQYSKEVEKCLRIWPQDNDTCGFFVAKVKKTY